MLPVWLSPDVEYFDLSFNTCSIRRPLRAMKSSLYETNEFKRTSINCAGVILQKAFVNSPFAISTN